MPIYIYSKCVGSYVCFAYDHKEMLEDFFLMGLDKVQLLDGCRLNVNYRDIEKLRPKLSAKINNMLIERAKNTFKVESDFLFERKILGKTMFLNRLDERDLILLLFNDLNDLFEISEENRDDIYIYVTSTLNHTVSDIFELPK